MHTTLYEIKTAGPGRLYMSSRPRGGDWLEDEIVQWRQSKIDIVVSLLERDEARELELGREAELCQNASIRFVSLPIPDRGLPADAQGFREIAAAMADELARGRNVLTHCRMGIGRAGMTATAIMIHRGYTAEDALEIITENRGRAVPDTEEQKRWLWKYAELHGPQLDD